jgi:hypothetical protein
LFQSENQAVTVRTNYLDIHDISQPVCHTLGGNFKQKMLIEHWPYFQPMWSYKRFKMSKKQMPTCVYFTRWQKLMTVLAEDVATTDPHLLLRQSSVGSGDPC